MSSISHNGDSISYTYDPDGIRTSKTVNGTTTKYHVMNGTLLGQTKGNDTIVFLYDEKANKYGFDYNGTKYYYIFNVQGDVIGILNQAGQKIVSYTYDPWGKVLSVDGSEASTIGQLNPIRYRGYYYDTETGFYYLQSRYYDPTVRRFLNADKVVNNGVGILGTNMFAYCINNPVNMFDNEGVAPEYINEQYADTVITVYPGVQAQMKDIGFGSFGNIAANGCGVIAAYNVIVAKEKRQIEYTVPTAGPKVPTSFGQVRDDLQQQGAPLLDGILGASPWAITNYLKNYYNNVVTLFSANLKNWGSLASVSDAIVVLYKNSNSFSMHYVSGIRVGGKWATFQFYNDRDVQGGAISIWTYLVKIKENGKVPLYLIGAFDSPYKF